MATYQTSIRGVVHAHETIRNADAYARVVFGDRVDSVHYKVTGKILHFSVIQRDFVSGDDKVQDLVDGLISGDDWNVNYEIQLIPTNQE